MNEIRWYDDDEDLKQLFAFLEEVPENARHIIADDILQILFQEIKMDVNSVVNELSKLKSNHNNRWYDKEVNIQSCIEIIKLVPKNQKRELIMRIVENLHQLIAKEGSL